MNLYRLEAGNGKYLARHIPDVRDVESILVECIRRAFFERTVALQYSTEYRVLSLVNADLGVW